MNNSFRVGHGFDVHAFTQGEYITLAGVRIPYTQGLLAHSDGDVVIHALVDALLGASALGDIGSHFPDTDPQWKNCASRIFLEKTNNYLHEADYKIQNIDITILAEAPKLKPYYLAMRKTLAEILNLSEAQISIKATTTERLGFIGRQEGLAATAVALITKAIF
jgi:2-C-methyl-D-erythritol 2,4-cyclodiphosphate synthase